MARIYDDLKNGFDLDRDGRADVALRVAPSNYATGRDFAVGFHVLIKVGTNIAAFA